ncbi:type II secretion system F family protein [Ilumatobacter nonamiensis]|uniref:type II secretion system F family protein n=1 Tax=Ilumatobacter nonamiensis TaxID=467093 RepID=UPI0003471172|nr:type II secretion system F family protein [Ilumatobacter nonamiensis]
MIVSVLAAVIVATSVGSLASASGRVVEPWSAAERDEPSERPRTARRGRSFLLVAAALAAIVVAGPMAALALGVAGLGWPSLRRVLAARADRRHIEASVPDAIDMLILVVHAGMTPHQAIVILSDRGPVPVRPALHEVRRRVAHGAPLAEALDALTELLGPSAAVVADTLAMSERYGTPIGHALEQLAIDVRERRRRQAEAEARKLPVRMAFPLVCCTLPSFVLLAIVPAVLAAMTSLNTSDL